MNAQEKKDESLVPVVIFGHTYNVRAEEDIEYIEELAQYIDTKMRSISEATGTSDALKVAVLAALNVADEFFKLEEDAHDVNEATADAVDAMADRLESSLREPTQTSPAVP